MFTVIELPAHEARHRFGIIFRTTWIVWDGWDDALTSQWFTLDEACRAAALMEWTRQKAEASRPIFAAETRAARVAQAQRMLRLNKLGQLRFARLQQV